MPRVSLLGWEWTSSFSLWDSASQFWVVINELLGCGKDCCLTLRYSSMRKHDIITPDGCDLYCDCLCKRNYPLMLIACHFVSFLLPRWKCQWWPSSVPRNMGSSCRTATPNLQACSPSSLWMSPTIISAARWGQTLTCSACVLPPYLGISHRACRVALWKTLSWLLQILSLH